MGYITKFSGNTDKTIRLGGPGNPASIEGYFLGSKTTPDNGFGPGKLHVFQTSEGSVGVWGKTRLNNLLTDDLKGQMVKATFTGMVAPSKKGRKPSYGYQVQHDPSNRTDVSGVDLNTIGTEDENSSSDENYGSVSQVESDDSSLDEVQPQRPQAPRVAAQTVSAERKAQLQALLNRNKNA